MSNERSPSDVNSFNIEEFQEVNFACFQACDSSALSEYELDDFDDEQDNKKPGKPDDDKASKERSVNDIYESGFKAGFEAGRKAGRQEANASHEKEFSEIKKLFNTMITDLNSFKQSLIDELQPKLIDLSMSIARKIIRNEIKTNKDILLSTVNDAIQMALGSEEIFIQVNHADYQYLECKNTEIMAKLPSLKNLKIEIDDSISRGGCKIHTEMGEIDATIEEQIGEIERALKR